MKQKHMEYISAKLHMISEIKGETFLAKLSWVSSNPKYLKNKLRHFINQNTAVFSMQYVFAMHCLSH